MIDLEKRIVLNLDNFDPFKVRLKPVFSKWESGSYITKPYRIVGWSMDSRVVTVEVRHKWNKQSKYASTIGNLEEIKVFLSVQRQGNTNQHPPVTIPVKF